VSARWNEKTIREYVKNQRWDEDVDGFKITGGEIRRTARAFKPASTSAAMTRARSFGPRPASLNNENRRAS
jgi:hypothetical protein